MSKSPSLRRIQADIRELAFDPSSRYHAAPLENDMFEWHFTIRGADGTDFEGGIYHGRILLPPEYPFKPPHIVMLTPSGRFETNTKVCLSFSAFHPELWQPAWGIRLILEALISFLPTPSDGAIGAVDWSPAERKKLAKQSVDFACPICGKVADLLPKLNVCNSSSKPSRFQKEIETLQRLQAQEHEKKTVDEEADEKKQSPKGTNSSPDTTSPIGDASSQVPAFAEQEQTDGETSDPLLVEEQSPVRPDSSLPSPPSPKAASADQVADRPRERIEAAPPEPVAETNHPPPPAVEAPRPLLQYDLTLNLELSNAVIDPILQGIILILSYVCYLLIRKIHDLMEDLKDLEP